MIVTAKHQIHPFDPVRELLIGVVAHVREGNHYIAFLMLPQVLSDSVGKVIAILVFQHPLVLVREDP